MTKNRFLAFVLDCGEAVGRSLALAEGITTSQVDEWLAALPAYCQAHHYTN
jgi:hypothetical protein